MELPNREQMVTDGIRRVVTKTDAFFLIEDVFAKYPNLKIHPANVYKLDYEGVIVETAKASDFEERSAMDNLFDGARLFKPK